MDNVVDFDAIRKQYEEKNSKKHKFVTKIKDTFYAIKEYCIKNPEIALFAVTTLVGAVGFLGRNGFRLLKLRKEAQVKDLYCYDRSLGHYWKLRRELTNDEWVAIDKRKRNGEKLADILDELKVLK